MCRLRREEQLLDQHEVPCTRSRDFGILTKYVVVVEYLLIERHKLLCLLFTLDAGEMEADSSALKMRRTSETNLGSRRANSGSRSQP